MGSLINILQLNSLISQPHQRPVLVSDRRFGIIHGNQMCLKISDNLISKNTSPWLYVENSFKAFLGKTFFDSINCFHAYVQHMRNRLIDRSLLLKHSLLTGKQNKYMLINNYNNSNEIWLNFVVPFTMKFISYNMDFLKFSVTDFDAGRV